MLVYSASPLGQGPHSCSTPCGWLLRSSVRGVPAPFLDILTLVRLGCMAETKAFAGGAIADFP